jgi:tetratricopeptide (TPR) repeat protein
MNEHEKAIECFTKALAIIPNHPDTYVSRAINYNVLGNYEAALDDVNMAEKLALAQGNFSTINNARNLKQKITDAIDSTNQLSRIALGLPVTKTQRDEMNNHVNNNYANMVVNDSKSHLAIKYAELRDLLVNKKWQEADELTVVLINSYFTKGNHTLLNDHEIDDEIDEFFIVDNLEKIPCDDLMYIDQLWVQYSNNRFGFSVQKEILDRLGGIPENNDWSRFEEFGRWVGWMSEPNAYGSRFFRAHQELYYPSLSAPRGHLPVKYYQLGIVSVLLFAIMKKFQDCQNKG